MGLSRSRVVLSFGAVAIVACSSGAPKASDPPAKKELVGDGDATRSKADVAKNALQPFTFEHRKALEKNRTLAFLDGCTPPGRYVFSGYSPGRSFAQARNQAELDANFALGAATLKTRLAAEGSLVADLRPVGTI